MIQDRLKIRVWDKYEKSYWLQSTIEQNIHWLMNPEEYKDASYPPDYVDIEQCTGSTDKNSKFIYEGDILQDSEQKILVKYDVNRYCFMFEYQDTRAYKPICDIDVLSGNFEVIGNIHENGNLLESKDE
jgi:uncharacterized phage protein (TIGR01671 family)